MREQIALALVVLGTLFGVASGAIALLMGVGILGALATWSLCGTGAVLLAVLWQMAAENDQAVIPAGETLSDH